MKIIRANFSQEVTAPTSELMAKFNDAIDETEQNSAYWIAIQSRLHDPVDNRLKEWIQQLESLQRQNAHLNQLALGLTQLSRLTTYLMWRHPLTLRVRLRNVLLMLTILLLTVAWVIQRIAYITFWILVSPFRLARFIWQELGPLGLVVVLLILGVVGAVLWIIGHWSQVLALLRQ